MKLVSWNIENAASRLSALPEVTMDLGSPDVLCLQELRIREQDREAVGALETALPGYRCFHSLPRDSRNVRFRGGRMYGVASFVRGRWRGEVPEWDREGRIVVVRKASLAIVNIYAVNGTSKPWYDEAGVASGDRHALKRRFQSSVMDIGRELRQHGGVILTGDWNVSRTADDTHPRLRTEEPHARARAELGVRMVEEGFVDIWRERNPKKRSYTWFNRRARGFDAARVDYILLSADLVPRVRTVEILDLIPWSDHAPVRMELE